MADEAGVASTLMLTTKCSAGCGHCPFGQIEMPKLELSLAEVERWMAANAESPLWVISGGEPFEHSAFAEILQLIDRSGTPYRIATGGHIDLAAWLPLLADLNNLEGISLGTDVLQRSDLSGPWVDNARLLHRHGISYSLTFTVIKDDSQFGDQLDWLSKMGLEPEFVYLRVAKPIQQNVIEQFRQRSKRDLKMFVDPLQSRFSSL